MMIYQQDQRNAVKFGETQTKTQVKTIKVGCDSLVKQCFSGSADTYKNKAVLQKELGADLLLLLPSEVNSREVVLDLGSGPGLFTEALSSLGELTISLDVSSSMLEVNNNPQTKLVCDSHNLCLTANSIDLIFSNLMVQWCDFERVIKEVYRVLKPGGEALISTLLPGSLFELQQAWLAVDNDKHIHQYQPLETIEESLAKLNCHSIQVQTKSYTYHYPSARALARELKSLGANAVKGREAKALCGKGKWMAMEREYTKLFADPNSKLLPATYRALTIKLTK